MIVTNGYQFPVAAPRTSDQVHELRLSVVQGQRFRLLCGGRAISRLLADVTDTIGIERRENSPALIRGFEYEFETSVVKFRFNAYVWG